MKNKLAAKIIEAYAIGLSAAGAGPIAAALQQLSSFLTEFADDEISTMVDRGARVGTEAQTKICSDLKSVPTLIARQIDQLVELLQIGGVTSASAKDLEKLAKLLRCFSESETLSAVIDKLRDAMKPDSVDQQIVEFIERLKRETGTASFDKTFAEFANSSLKREHVVAVAMSVYGGIKKAISRKGALDYIRKPHDAYMSAKRGIDATGGRSAA